MTFRHSGLLHASKGSSFLRHLALSLQLVSICSLWKKINFEDNQKQYILEVTTIIALLGFDQSDLRCKIKLILLRKRSMLDNL